MLSIRRQCELLSLSRSTYYAPGQPESPDDLRLMRLIDEEYLKTPFYGSRRMVESLQSRGERVNRKRIQRLMRTMGLHGLSPGPHTSKPHPRHEVYPYLLRGLTIERPDHVWSADITFVPMPRGFMYLVAILDWYSRFVVSWRLSNTLESHFCVKALETALRGARPEIFNTDQGAQFTAATFVAAVLSSGAKMSMDGRGRALDNVFIERLWRTVKYELIYLRSYDTVPELERGLEAFFDFYNTQRPHQSLAYRTPVEVYRGSFPQAAAEKM